MSTLLRRIRGVPVLVLLLGLAALALSGGPAAAQPQAPGQPPNPDVTSAAPRGSGTPVGDPAQGRKLYAYWCSSCHGMQAQGSQRGPSLVGVGEATVDFYLRTGRMPLPLDEQNLPQQVRREPAKLGQQEISDIDAYVGSLGRGGTPIPDVAPGDLGEGRTLYLENCASCHAPSGIGYTQVGGEIAPDLFGDDPTAIAEAIRIGPVEMPQFPESVFDQHELNSLVTYVQYLKKRDVGGQGGVQLGRLGASTETLVAFVVLAGLLVLLRLNARKSAEKRS